jgi:thiamine-phosphate pyrophosphorylase
LKFNLPKIYPITDTSISGLSHAAQVGQLAAGGARLIQLREKHASPRDFYEYAARAMDAAHNSGVRIIINDRVDIALTLGAAGVHLGQDDLPPARAREMLGADAIIGLSTHTAEQALEALSEPIDYIAIGPVFQTGTKEKADAVIGLDGLRDVRSLIGEFPLVAIGGITSDRVRSVFDAGAGSAAMIAALLSEPARIEERMRELILASI